MLYVLNMCSKGRLLLQYDCGTGPLQLCYHDHLSILHKGRKHTGDGHHSQCDNKFLLSVLWRDQVGDELQVPVQALVRSNVEPMSCAAPLRSCESTNGFDLDQSSLHGSAFPENTDLLNLPFG